MKKALTHLPKHKRAELHRVASKTCKAKIASFDTVETGD